jgi:mRNA interferase RelE/StbE
MLYQIKIKRQADRTLKRLRPQDRLRITEKIDLLGQNPDNPTLDIKRLQGQFLYHLRVGQWRVIFDRQEVVKVISIEKIKPRGDAY